MSSKHHLQSIFAYHFDTTRRLLDRAEALTDTEYRNKDVYGDASIHDIFVHLYMVSYGWRVGLDTGVRPPAPGPETVPDPASLRAGFAREEALWQEVFSRWTSAQIDGEIELTRQNVTVKRDLWRCLHHVMLHGMQHHSELARLLTLKGQSPGDIDYIFFQE